MVEQQKISVIEPECIAQHVSCAIAQIACSLRADYRASIEDCLAQINDERNHYSSQAIQVDQNNQCVLPERDADRAYDVLEMIVENDDIAQRDHAPLCQDTGSVWVCLEIGPDISIRGDIFSQVDEAVARAYQEGRLRMSLVRDALFDRSNTQNNTPSFCEIKTKDTPGATLHVMLKGGGSDNASKVVMCPPSAGRAGIIDEVIDCVRQKAANACPPLVVGIGIGSTFDKVAGLAKHALLRPIGQGDTHTEIKAFERELLERINALNIGPGALGGSPTALAVHVETAPCHIAALPLAINMGCCAMRSTSIELI